MLKYIAFLLLISCFSCTKYVEIEQKGIRTLKYTTDYRALLNDNNMFEGGYGYPIISGDDVEFTDPVRIRSLSDIWKKVYVWDEKYTSESQGDIDWEKLYSVIYTCNLVIEGVISSLNGTETQKQQLYAEALVHRAYAYFWLVNLYGKQYDKDQSAADPGVPLLLTPNLYTKLVRVSVQKVYDQITSDLLYAVSRLPKLPDYNVRPAKVSAYALLARTYLNMRDFTFAGKYADSSLQLQNTLLDLKTYEGNTTAIPQRLIDPEIMLSKLVNGFYNGISLSTRVQQLLDPKDLRYTLYTKTGSSFPGMFSPGFTGRVYWRHRYTNEGIYIGPSVPEMMLVKAECSARSGDAPAAIELLNKLRINRFSTANYVAYGPTDATDALKKVLAERERELFGLGFRWFDQKRLNKDAAFAVTVTRTFNNIQYILAPGSNRYAYPIGDKYILLNPELEQNPR